MVVEKTALPSRVRPVGGALRMTIQLGSWLGIASLVALLLVEGDSRLGLGADFGVLRLSAYVGALAAVLALVAGILLVVRHKRRPSLLLVIGLLAGLTAFWVPYSERQRAQPVDSNGIPPATGTVQPAPGDAGR